MGFGNVTNQSLTPGATIEVELNQLTIFGEHPIIVCEHLGESNSAFWNDAIAKAGTQAAKEKDGGKLTPADIENGRRKNRETVIKYSAKSTRGFFHDFPEQPGVPNPDHPALATDTRAIILALPPEVFDSLLKIIVNAENFRARPAMAEPKALAEK